MYSTIIIDDEKLARQRIKTLLENDNQITVVAECANGKSAIEKIQKHKPDFIFLDIQMPEKNGLQVLREIEPQNMPLTIFATAYDKYAIQAFEVNALDYLLKPFDDERFYKTIERVKKGLDIPPSESKIENLVSLINSLEKQGKTKRISVKQSGKIHFIKSGELISIKADGKFILLNLLQQQYKIRKKISEIEQELDPNTFIRVHRSSIVNLNHIIEMEHWHKGEYVLFMSNNDKIISSNAYKENLKKLV